MTNFPWLVRDAVGAVVSAAVTGGLFGLPLLALLGPARHDLTSVVLEQAHRSALLEAPMAERPVELAGLFAGIPNPSDAPVAPEEERPEAEERVEEGDEGSDARTADRGGSAAGDGVADASAAGRPGAGANPDASDAPGSTTRARIQRPGGVGELGDGDGDSPGVATARKGRKSRCAAEHPQIMPKPDGHYVVARELVEYYTSSFERLKSLGWSGRYDEEDERGWQVSGFGCNSVLYHAGLRRGDVIQSVNGKQTKNVLQVFATWKKLRKHDAFEVHLLRKGEPVTLRYVLI